MGCEKIDSIFRYIFDFSFLLFDLSLWTIFLTLSFGRDTMKMA